MTIAWTQRCALLSSPNLKFLYPNILPNTPREGNQHCSLSHNKLFPLQGWLAPGSTVGTLEERFFYDLALDTRHTEFRAILTQLSLRQQNK